MIKVSINNTMKAFHADCTVKQALDTLGYKEDALLGVAVNQMFISKDHWEETILKENDTVDILNPMSGG